MPARKLYEDYYQTSSLAKKVEVSSKKIDNNSKIEKKSIKAQNKMALFPFILGIFVMTLILSVRYTTINEKNVESMSLKSELEKSEAALFNAKIAVEQSTDLDKIEAYAKQQLGMQKPTKNQIIYVDTSEDIGTVEIVKSKNVFSEVKSNILNFINNIF